ncbi:MAG: endonuclease domain-containing protein [Fimbriiglobus sp.]
MTRNERANDLRLRLTETERFVWAKLRGRRFEGFKFRRQVSIGNYIVDFVCFESRLILELDGGQHGEPDHHRADQIRDLWLKSQGFSVHRFWNHEVLADWETIEEHLWGELMKAREGQSS